MEGVGGIAVDPTFWRGRKVFLSGHTGFKGAWLSLWLQDCGAVLKGYALAPNTQPNLYDEAGVATGMESVIGDVRDLDGLVACLRSFSPEVVIHMAAQPLVRESYENPVDTYSTNVMGTVNILEAARNVESIKAIVNVTTDKCYDNKEWIWGYREDEPMGGRDPYSSSKGCSELVTSAYRSSFFEGASSASVASARAGNVVGGGDWARDRLVPDILKSFERKEPVSIRSPRATRPWQHVLEPLSGYLSLAEQLFKFGDDFAEAWNFGPVDADVKSVGYVTDYMATLWGEEAHSELDIQKHVHEASSLKLDISKSLSRLDWEPKWRLENALDSIVAWHKGWLSGECPKELCQNEIKNFMRIK